VGRKKRAESVLKSLRKVIPAPETELLHENPYELLVAVMLSAQCTDARVNKVTPAFYEAFPEVHVLAETEPEDVFPYISSISYPNNKSKHLVGAARMIMEEFEGRVPSTVETLKRLPGVGRKTAQVVASVAFGRATLAVDTHVFRVANRIGLVREDASTPARVERQLKRILDEKDWGEAHHLLILHGRYTCTARSPSCPTCAAAPHCKTFGRIQKLPDPVDGLDPSRGRYWCGTRRHYFDRPDLVSDRSGTEQVSCPRCGSMNVFHAKTGETTKRVRDYRV
jgi:endonuclease-3